jgi:RimJ/RimL family protein N-acetyltransferase
LPAGSLSEQQQPRLRAGELVLREWRDADAPAVVRAYRDPDIQRWHARSMTEHDALEWVQSWRKRWGDEVAVGWAVTERARLVRRAGIQRIDLHEGLAEVAYWVVPDARGRGVATTAASAVINWAFDQIGFHRLELTHATVNHASCRTASKLGFTFEGVMRQQGLHLDGWHDMHLHSLLEYDQR